jgi:hypothetical protein
MCAYRQRLSRRAPRAIEGVTDAGDSNAMAHGTHLVAAAVDLCPGLACVFTERRELGGGLEGQHGAAARLLAAVNVRPDADEEVAGLHHAAAVHAIAGVGLLGGEQNRGEGEW